LGAVLAACSSSGNEKEPGVAAHGDTEVVSELTSSERREPADTRQAAAAARSERDFALRFLKQLPADQNLAFSPHVLSQVFAKLTDAADGQTLEQIQQAFNFGTTDESFHRAQNALLASLAERNREAIDDGTGRHDAVVLTEASDLWITQTAPPQASYLDTLARYYGVGVQRTDFQNRPEKAREAINSKVSMQTNRLIPELLRAGSVTDETVLVLTSALYFKAPWATPFHTAFAGEFHPLSGDPASAQMLNRTLPLAYYEGDHFVSVSVPYRGDQLGMLLVVPEEGAYDAVREALSAEAFDAIVNEAGVTAVDLTLPKLDIASEVPAKATLQKLGLTNAFERGAASFPKLESEQASHVFLSEVVQQATVSVDEHGTEASAAVAVVGSAGGSAGPAPEPKVVTVDRPFLFAIRDNVTGSLLFVGQVVSP
jgi:serpin B